MLKSFRRISGKLYVHYFDYCNMTSPSITGKMGGPTTNLTFLSVSSFFTDTVTGLDETPGKVYESWPKRKLCIYSLALIRI